ncbi:hypothetical protein [Brachybacterium sp. GU-2]|uniref:hypothetical protein n=1 Tax=Brachybacterium sp. GU-2 TaxID=3069708 RepID=UPI00280C2D54|nr:hypothetical protein [Brachybacterium sp. GU-2]WME22161.1 hypothetical protein RBL05_11505 [Brachybacterium sp. GU-2]
MADNPIVALIIAAMSGGGIAAIIGAVASWRKGVREQDVAEDQNALQGYKDLAEERRQDLVQYKADMAELRADMRAKDQENETRFKRIESELSVERSTRWAAVQYARDLVALIARRLPGVSIPVPPDSLADHIIIPSGKDSL